MNKKQLIVMWVGIAIVVLMVFCVMVSCQTPLHVISLCRQAFTQAMYP